VTLEVEEIDDCSPEISDAVRYLLSQLSRSARAPSDDYVQQMIASEATHLFFARSDGQIVGMLTLVVFPIPSGVRAWIEDVVVDSKAQGKGIGEILSKRAIERATELGARTIELTSRPSREAANRLYQRLGFERRETNVYRYH
jgi:ribosomal protein S18 acetylase RimI-like enzyme